MSLIHATTTFNWSYFVTDSIHDTSIKVNIFHDEFKPLLKLINRAIANDDVMRNFSNDEAVVISGILDELQDKVADLIRCRFQKFDKALVIRVTQRHYSWIAFFPWTEITGLDWQARESFEKSIGKHRTQSKIFGIVREFFRTS